MGMVPMEVEFWTFCFFATIIPQGSTIAKIKNYEQKFNCGAGGRGFSGAGFCVFLGQ